MNSFATIVTRGDTQAVVVMTTTDGSTRADEIVFDPETIEVMRRALEQAWSSLTPRQQASIGQSAVAEQILRFARQGETDAKRLCACALMTLTSRTAAG